MSSHYKYFQHCSTATPIIPIPRPTAIVFLFRRRVLTLVLNLKSLFCLGFSCVLVVVLFFPFVSFFILENSHSLVCELVVIPALPQSQKMVSPTFQWLQFVVPAVFVCVTLPRCYKIHELFLPIPYSRTPTAAHHRPLESPVLCFILHIFLSCHFLLYSRLLPLKRGEMNALRKNYRTGNSGKQSLYCPGPGI